MYSPQDETQRYSRNGADPYHSAVPEGSGNGGLIALLVIVVFMGGVIAFSSVSSTTDEAPLSTPAAETPDSITGGGGTVAD